mmetsp:Transcript_18419/g.40415  ORF Transcript_18419/g.40415 Transcript_18419/m.40415 type:complete len:155 (+) Transcript_18419:41-505(+)|eukprot:CAMPEP_0180486720 /NCGR_PEP_ID=MMETSP1036_2-20121128/37143_1 /TAXON_ID=632150 /ORGANISM="Azadinium spinosum, Strain 3D9" /LENGTH=154 /DNA_ID=CAMNT_0022494687 /DNA_START=8 /DNA_END=472 /DNA_ORIENTATION=+
MICRDELEKQSIPMGSLTDWHKVQKSPTVMKAYSGPITMSRKRTVRRDTSHLWVERPNADFGSPGLYCGRKGWLKSESLDDWFQEFGRPIAQKMDVTRFSSALLRPSPQPSMRTELKVERMHQSPAGKLAVRRLAMTPSMSTGAIESARFKFTV